MFIYSVQSTKKHPPKQKQKQKKNKKKQNKKTAKKTKTRNLGLRILTSDEDPEARHGSGEETSLPLI